MTDEAKPPKKRPAGAAKWPRKPAADAARPPRKPPAKATKPGPADVAADAAAIDAAATQVLATDDTPTQVLEADVAPTQVVPPGDGAQPPFAPVPHTVTASGGGDRRTTLWIVLALAAAAVITLVLVWAFVLRDNGEQFVGSWAPVSGEGGGLVIAQTDGDFEVSMYDTDLQLTGTYPATQDGDALTFRFTDTQTQLGMVAAKLTYEEDRDVLVLRLTAMGEAGAAIEFTRVDSLEAAPAATPTPTVTQSPTASPSASPTGSPSPTPSPTGTDTAQYDQKVVDGIVAIQVGVLNWAAANNNVFPPVAEATRDGDVAQYVSAWPTNPFTGQPMAASDQEGDYTYEQLNGGLGYKLVGHLANGLTFTVP